MFFKNLKKSIKISIALTIGSFGTLMLAPTAKSEYWQDHECFYDYDANYNLVQVCMDGYNIGIFWDDGSYVNGYCTSRSDYNVDYYGLSKRDAISWVDYYC